MSETTYFECPACGYGFDSEDIYHHVSYWGDDGVREDECPNCETTLEITERVSREWEVKVVILAQEHASDE